MINKERTTMLHKSLNTLSQFKRILLIKPNYRGCEAWFHFIKENFPPLNLTYIASYLVDMVVEVEIIDAKVKNLSYNQIRKKIEKYKPDIVGISVFVSAAINICYDIAKIVKDYNQNCTVVFGGRHPTFVPDETLNVDEVDIVVRGEGELTFRELIIKGTPEKVKGISYKSNGKIIHNPDRELIKDFDKIRYPARHLVKNNNYSMFNIRVETVETSRGCPYSCKFCTTPVINNGLWRPRPVENIISELKIISQNKKISDIFFVDDNITADTKRFERLCERIIECKKNNEIADFKFNSQIRLDALLKSPQLVKKMAGAGFWMILTGIESIREKTQKNLRKGLAFDKVLKALEILHNNNIIVSGNMIIGGDLNRTEKEIREDIRFMHKIDIEFLPFSLLTPFPGTPILKELEEKNLLITKDWSKYTILNPVIKTYKLSPEKLRTLLGYSYKELKYLNHPGRMILRVIKTRGIMFVLNPIRFLSIVISYLKMRVFYRQIN